MRLGTFRYQGYTLGYEVHGDGERTIVLTNGLLLDAGVNRQLARSLAARGFRVVLLDLLGHGRSDKPHHASQHRMDRYARQVVGVLDELGVERAVVGGVSLGANVALHVAVQAPDRVAALIVEMPVLEWATPAAASLFVPLLLAVRFGRRLFGFVTSLIRRLPRTGIDPVDSFLGTFSLEPEAIAAVLHGILVGPVAPEIEERRAITAPTLIIGHENDLIHPFSDAENLAQQIPGARLVQARSMFELRLAPERLTREIVRFLDDVYGAPAPARPVASGESVAR
ncbi:MAG TPA: alpha/beta hydrolase [Candidatus Eisenbacteria bacterium]|nr:alpha/beta hydrolase [Candidatus Eisenbacteria bacterium]